MIDQTEVDMAVTIQYSRQALINLLTSTELQTKRKAGSDHPHTFEDSAREVANSDNDKRSWAVGLALANFQSNVNALWEYAIEQEIPGTITKKWVERRKAVLDAVCATLDDAISEANVALRFMIVRFDPTRGTRLITYAGRAMYQALDLWYLRQQVPVELPEKVARNGSGLARCAVEEYTDVWDEEDFE